MLAGARAARGSGGRLDGVGAVEVPEDPGDTQSQGDRSVRMGDPVGDVPDVGFLPAGRESGYAGGIAEPQPCQVNGEGARCSGQSLPDRAPQPRRVGQIDLAGDGKDGAAGVGPHADR